MVPWKSTRYFRAKSASPVARFAGLTPDNFSEMAIGVNRLRHWRTHMDLTWPVGASALLLCVSDRPDKDRRDKIVGETYLERLQGLSKSIPA